MYVTNSSHSCSRAEPIEILCFASKRWNVRRGIFASFAALEMFPSAFTK